MPEVLIELERAAWAVAEGRATKAQRAAFEADTKASLRVLGRMIIDTEEGLESVTRLTGPEREQIVADFTSTLRELEALHDLLSRPLGTVAADVLAEVAGEVRLQASWSTGTVVVWAAGPKSAPETNDQLADRLEAIGGPSLGWAVHPGVPLPSGARAEALSIPVRDALGWLVAVGTGLGRAGVGSSVAWLGRVAVEGVRLVAAGAVAPAIAVERSAEGRQPNARVHWEPALLDETMVRELAAAMPGPVSAIARVDARSTTLAVLAASVDAIVRDTASRLDLPAPPPMVSNPADFAEAMIARLDGTSFPAPAGLVGDVSRRLDQWTRTATSAERPHLIMQLDAPDSGDAWLLSVFGPGAKGRMLPVEVALGDTRNSKPLADELARLERIYPPLLRPGELRRGRVVLSQPEAWELMTVLGSQLEAAGFEVRVPALSRRKASPSLKLWAEPTGQSVVGANQLSNVRWSVLFDDVELTAADIARLSMEAKPLVRSRGRWIEIDSVDLKEAAAALAERSRTTQLTGAEILRHSVGLEGSGLAGGVSVQGSGWATDLLRHAATASTEPVTQPEGFRGELRSYQAQAVAWLGFLDTAELGGCLALDMGLGKTPTVLAHIARTSADADYPALVIAPPAVVGNWAAEAAKFAPRLRVIVHHGASRASATQLDAEISRADVILTTYATAVRDIEALSRRRWSRVVLDEAQAIKNSANETSQQLRRLQARSKIALTGTPIENGLGDLWSILDFTNPGLVGTRPSFVAQMSGEGEAALRALNGLLVFRRTKTEPEVAKELPDKIDQLDHCTMTPEQIGLYQAVLDRLLIDTQSGGELGSDPKQGAILAAITALKQICNHPSAYHDDGQPLAGRSGKLARLEEIVESVFEADEKILVFTHFASWGRRLATYLSGRFERPIDCYDGSLARTARDAMIEKFQKAPGAGALVLSLKAGGTGLNLTAASHVVLYDRWWNPAVEDQARDRAWRIGQQKTVVSHRLVCPGTVDERVEEVVLGKRHIADLVLPKSSSLSDLNTEQLRVALGLRPDVLLTEDDE
jgi:hypothetical protein